MANLKIVVTRKQSAPNFLKTIISYPLKRTCAYQEVRNSFAENLACFVSHQGERNVSFFFLVTIILKFGLLSYYRCILQKAIQKNVN